MSDETQQPQLRANYQWKPISQTQAETYGLAPSEPVGRMAVGDVRVVDTWLEVPIGSGWLAAYRLSVNKETGATAFSEVRIYPDEPQPREPGQWSGEFRGRDASPSQVPLTTRVIRRVRPDVHRKALAKLLENVKRQRAERAFGNITVPHRGVGRLGGRPERAAFYAKFALRYDEIEYGDERRRSGARSTRQVMADEYQVPPTTVTGWIRAARALGFLEKTTTGKRGGRATDSARALAGETPLR